MRRKVHKKTYFLDWLEKKLPPQQMNEIDRHLQSCAECRNYFEKMKMLLAEADGAVLPTLEPDYFLPTKIVELARKPDRTPSMLGLLKARFPMVLKTAVVVFGLLIGILLGKWMSYPQHYSDTEIVLSYASMFSDEGIGEIWEDVIVENNGEGQ